MCSCNNVIVSVFTSIYTFIQFILQFIPFTCKICTYNFIQDYSILLFQKPTGIRSQTHTVLRSAFKLGNTSIAFCIVAMTSNSRWLLVTQLNLFQNETNKRNTDKG